MNFREAVEEFLESKKLAKNSKDTYRNALLNFQAYHTEMEDTDGISLHIVRMYLDLITPNVLETDEQIGQYRSALLAISVIRQFLTFLHKEGYRDFSGMSIKLPVNIKEWNKIIKPKIIMKEDVEAVLDIVDNLRGDIHGLKIKALVYFLRDTGVTCEEVSKLHRYHIDLKKRAAVVGSPQRTVYYLQDTAEKLSKYIRTRDAEIGRGSPLFCGWDGEKGLYKCISPRTVEHIFSQFGIKGFTPNSFRNYLIQFLLKGKMEDTDVQKLIGHASVQSTRKHRLEDSTLQANYERTMK